MTPKKVVYVVVDGMGTEAFEQATSSGRAPALDFIRRNGTYVRDSVAIFPTITPAATASLLTGATPAEHRVPGMCWYDRDASRFVNYGQSPRAALAEGLSQIVRDVMFNLNARHLSPDVKTIHEQLDALGVSSASINFMLFRGNYLHDCDPNILAKSLFRKTLPEKVPGPKELYFADAISGPSDACSKLLGKGSFDQRLRATDEWAACVTRDLIEKDAAQMILFYLHENDHTSHREGPASQVENLAQADQHIAYVLDAFPTWDEALDELGFVVTADHSQSPISDDRAHILDLFDVLDDFKLLKPKKGKEQITKKVDLAAAGNGRVGFVYLNEDRKEKLAQPVIHTLLECPGIDQVMWRGEDRYWVSCDRGTLSFRRAESEGVVDERGNKWVVDGELAAVDGVVEEDEIRTPEYPLALWRIKEALDLDRVGDIMFTNRLTWETKDLAGGDHRGGGDHASLHAQDSLVPFVSTLDEPPLHPSTIDVVPHIVSYFERSR